MPRDTDTSKLPTSDGTREQLIERLRRVPHTVDELAAGLHLTPNAIRVQLAALERDGLVSRVGKRPGARRPSILYGLTEAADRALSNAYPPVLVELLRQLARTLDRRTLRKILRDVGEKLAAPHLPTVGAATRGSARVDDAFRARVDAAIEALRTLGASVEVERDPGGAIQIRGLGCPLADAVKESPCVCLALERLLQTLVGTRVRERCDRSDRPKCRFVVSAP